MSSCGGRVRELFGVPLTRALITFLGNLPSWHNYLLRPQLLMLSHWRLGFQCRNFVGTQTFSLLQPPKCLLGEKLMRQMHGVISQIMTLIWWPLNHQHRAGQDHGLWVRLTLGQDPPPPWAAARGAPGVKPHCRAYRRDSCTDVSFKIAALTHLARSSGNSMHLHDLYKITSLNH